MFILSDGGWEGGSSDETCKLLLFAALLGGWGWAGHTFAIVMPGCVALTSNSAAGDMSEMHTAPR